jgi:hypothetical protein
VPLLERSHQHPPRGLKTRQQIALSDQREDVLLKRAERKHKEEEVRHQAFDLFQRKVLLAIAVVIAAAMVIGILGHPEIIKLALAAASAFTAISAVLLRFRQKPRSLS